MHVVIVVSGLVKESTDWRCSDVLWRCCVFEYVSKRELTHVKRDLLHDCDAEALEVEAAVVIVVSSLVKEN